MPMLMVDSDGILGFLEGLLEKADANVLEYEEFHAERLANIREMQPMDSFLYGIATGKKMIIEDIINEIEDYLQGLEEE